MHAHTQVAEVLKKRRWRMLYVTSKTSTFFSQLTLFNSELYGMNQNYQNSQNFTKALKFGIPYFSNIKLLYYHITIS